MLLKFLVKKFKLIKTKAIIVSWLINKWETCELIKSKKIIFLSMYENRGNKILLDISLNWNGFSSNEKKALDHQLSGKNILGVLKKYISGIIKKKYLILWFFFKNVPNCSNTMLQRGKIYSQGS